MGLEILIRAIGPFKDGYGLSDVDAKAYDALVSDAWMMVGKAKPDAWLTYCC